MTTQAMLVLLLASLPVPQVQFLKSNPEPHPTASRTAKPVSHKRGKWYFARSGHAVYCYGPVMTVANPDGGIEHVATFCHGGQLLVPLKD